MGIQRKYWLKSNISRAEQDQFAGKPPEGCKAVQESRFKEEVLPIEVNRKDKW